MKVGESFFIPTHDPISIRSQLYWQGRRFGYNLIFREMFYRGYYGLMTWRDNDGRDEEEMLVRNLPPDHVG